MANAIIYKSGAPDGLWFFPYSGNSATIDTQFITLSTLALLNTYGKNTNYMEQDVSVFDTRKSKDNKV
jgi:hypothetical protein